MEVANLIALPPDETPARPSYRPLPLIERDEPRVRRVAAALLAAAIAVAYFWFIFQYWAPSHPGVDQNGYLVGGKMLAQTGSTGMKPAEPLGFVSNMWVRNDATGWNYPKYPVGLPLLYAIVLWTCGAAGPKAAFLISPIGAAMAVLGMYFLARRFAGPFASLCAMLLLAFSPVTLVLADNPNSHASCLAFCVWGVFLLIRFWETGSIWRGILAGFLLGFAATIRYTEGLLGLLIGAVVLCTIVSARFRDWRDWRGHVRWIAPVLGWVIPMLWLVLFNRIAMGTWTGYDTTNESKPGQAFTWANVADNWELFFRKVHDTGLFFTLPLGVLGMCLALRTGMRRASLLWLWLVPGTAVYLSYYWAPERGVSYLRFFLTLLPPLVIGTAVVIDLVIASAATRFGRLVSPLMGGLIVAIACGMNLYRGQLGLEDGQETGVGMEAQFRQQMNLAALADVVTGTVPKGSVLLSQSSQLNDLQFAGNYDCFATEYFTSANVTRLKAQRERLDHDDPNPLQPARRDYLISLTDNKTDDQLAQMQIDLIRRSIAAGKRVFLLAPRSQVPAYTRRYERPDTGLTWVNRARFDELPRLNNAGDDSQPANAPGRRGGGGGRGAMRPARPGNGALREVIQRWTIVELTRRPDQPPEAKPAPKPEVKSPAKPAAPAPKPAAKPAAPKPADAKPAPAAVKPPEPKPTTPAGVPAPAAVPAPAKALEPKAGVAAPVTPARASTQPAASNQPATPAAGAAAK